jgi:glycerophosphoryl diester phosphodiesterase
MTSGRALVGIALAVAVCRVTIAQIPEASLVGFARLPADTFAAGPPSGAFLTADAKPFPHQPVEGFSSIRPVPGSDGWWYALTDNGYGAKANSRDFLLRIYRVRPAWPRSHQGNVGKVDVARDFIQLADPDRRVPFPIIDNASRDRVLTGADFDPESFVLDQDGSFWIGDEFGPFLLHVDARGRVLEAPIAAPGIRSPDHPDVISGSASATVARSKGFEGLAASEGSDILYAALEGGVIGDPPNTTRILEFNRAERRFTGASFKYAFEDAGHSLSELVAVPPAGRKQSDEPLRFLAIERDDGQGSEARFKRVFHVYLTSQSRESAGGDAVKREVLDLLSIGNPSRLGDFGPRFTFPFITTEALWPVTRELLVIVNDNNYPGTGGRAKDVKDATEFIRVRLAKPFDVE